MPKSTPSQIIAARAYYRKNRETVLEKARAARAEKGMQPRRILTPEEKAEAARARAKAYYQSNKREILMRQNFPENFNRMKAHRIRCQINNLITKTPSRGKTGRAVSALGISIEEFRAYIASKFTEGMTWENYGKWELDHIEPLSNFNLADDEEYNRACHYTNYQPLWAKKNKEKGAS